MRKKLILICVVLILLVSIAPGIAFADAGHSPGPHAGYREQCSIPSGCEPSHDGRQYQFQTFPWVIFF